VTTYVKASYLSLRFGAGHDPVPRDLIIVARGNQGDGVSRYQLSCTRIARLDEGE